MKRLVLRVSAALIAALIGGTVACDSGGSGLSADTAGLCPPSDRCGRGTYLDKSDPNNWLCRALQNDSASTSQGAATSRQPLHETAQ